MLRDRIVSVIETMKGIEPVVLSVAELTPLSDYFVIASGRSSRHIKAMADSVQEVLNRENIRPLGEEGEADSWLLLDYSAVVVHLMTVVARQHYDLENLWKVGYWDTNQDNL